MVIRFNHFYNIITQNKQHNAQQHEEKHLDNCSIAAADTDCQR